MAIGKWLINIMRPFMDIYNSSHNFGRSLLNKANILQWFDCLIVPTTHVVSNEDITWETTSSLDIGVDLGFLGNKLNIEADYFNKKTTDICSTRSQ